VEQSTKVARVRQKTYPSYPTELAIEQMRFEKVETFKYIGLGIDIIMWRT